MGTGKNLTALNQAIAVGELLSPKWYAYFKAALWAFVKNAAMYTGT